jgi:enoyl-[acyl-carrier protein] reductase II
LHSALHTPICDYFGIAYPIFLAGMGGVSTAPLVAAVSEAGGLGVIGAATMGPDDLRDQIRQTRDLTDKPFAVDLLAPNPDRIRPQVDVIFEEDVRIFVAGLAVPSDFIEEMHARGIKVIVMCGKVRHAQKSEQAGADVVVAQGTEAGGHTGEIGTLALVPQVVDAVRIPVLAAGGIVDGRGVVASLALGAQGAVIGTRFIASNESQAAQGYRDAIVGANDDSTMRTRAYTGKPARTIKTDYAEEWETRTEEIQPFPMQAGVSIQNHVMDYMGRTPLFDAKRTFLPAGQGSGAIHSVQPAADIFRDIVNEAEQIIRERFGGAVPSRPA